MNSLANARTTTHSSCIFAQESILLARESLDIRSLCRPQGRDPDCLFGYLQHDGTKYEERLPLELATVEGCKQLSVKFGARIPQRPEKAALHTFESFGNASTMKVFMIIEQGTKICIRIVRTN